MRLIKHAVAIYVMFPTRDSSHSLNFNTWYESDYYIYKGHHYLLQISSVLLLIYYFFKHGRFNYYNNLGSILRLVKKSCIPSKFCSLLCCIAEWNFKHQTRKHAKNIKVRSTVTVTVLRDKYGTPWHCGIPWQMINICNVTVIPWLYTPVTVNRSLFTFQSPKEAIF